MTRRRRTALLALPLLLLGPAAPARPEALPIEISASALASFRIGSDETRFGRLDYVGGFSYRASDRRLRGVSSFRFTEGRDAFLAVTDTGEWVSGRIRRDAEGRPVGFSEARIAPILAADREAQTRKGDADAEGLAIRGGEVLVSFERDHRIESFAGPAAPFESLPSPVPQPVPPAELRSNGGLETIAVSPASGPLGGRAVVVAEQSIDPAGNLFAAVLGEAGGVFTVRKDRAWAVTDGAFLPGGDLLLLERRYEGFGRVGMRIRRVEGGTIRAGALVDGDVLIEADLSHEIDNMEGLDVAEGPDGEITLSLVSDNNGSFFQRNLYLEFRLAPDEAVSQ